MIGIYKITSPSGKVYIGQAVDTDRRFKVYSNLQCSQQVRLYRSLGKYGVDKHTFEVIEECLFEELNIRERYWQDFYDVLGPMGLNCKLTGTGELPVTYSEEMRGRISKALMGRERSEESKIKQSISIAGKKRHPMKQETKDRIGAAIRGNKLSEEVIARRTETRRRNAELKGKKY